MHKILFLPLDKVDRRLLSEVEETNGKHKDVEEVCVINNFLQEFYVLQIIFKKMDF